MIIKRGSKGEIVQAIQQRLDIVADGDFGPKTEAAVKLFQQEKGMHVDGLVGPKTLQALGINIEELITTDGSEAKAATEEGLCIQNAFLDKGEYIHGPTDKFFVFLHHTAGGNNPFATIRNWNNDTRGRIATQFVVGGPSKTGNLSHDGEVVQCFPDEAWAYHLGKNNCSLLHPHSIGIEICNYGWLREENGSFFTYVNSVLPEDQVIDLGFSFRGYRYYHKYSEAQIEAVSNLLQEIARRHPQVNLHAGLHDWLAQQSPAEAFDFKEEACNGSVRGLLTHANTRTDKTDCSPQPLLVAMLNSL